jgi:hypothetical protein
MSSSIEELLHLVDEAFDTKAWHGPTLRGALRGVTAGQAAWRASRGSHNIWELTIHAAYWKYAVRRMLTSDKRGSFARTGSNWFPRPSDPGAAAQPEERAWQAEVKLLAAEHRQLRASIAGLTPDALGRRVARKPYTVGFVVRGIAAHDLYHAGQIQLLKRMIRDRTDARANR